MKAKLLVSEKNKEKILNILSSNNIIIDETANILIAEDKYCNCDDGDIKIIFSDDKLEEFSNFTRLLSYDIVSDGMILGMGNSSFVPIEIKDISYFNAVNNEIFANLENGKQYTVKKKLYQLEEEFYSAGFFRINKSELVNMKKITLISPMFKGKLIIKLAGYKEYFDISKGYTRAFKERLGF
ncbi:MAG: LytTR family DNA-binding domain-containing protein [Eubacteriales bacterium]